ncbi:RNA dependent RNA polymerase-domain-containing protein [Xylaria nigripes]|nr:RNA dependent RNA polymerase-domain-containing protein [Xylaria nigripes]
MGSSDSSSPLLSHYPLTQPTGVFSPRATNDPRAKSPGADTPRSSPPLVATASQNSSPRTPIPRAPTPKATNGRAGTRLNHRTATAGTTTAVSKRRHGRHFPVAQQQLGVKPDWEDWHELAVRVSSLPQSVSTLELVNFFSLYGTIAYIDISVQHKTKTAKAVVRFSPVPRQAFWNNQMSFKTGAGTYYITAVLLTCREREEVTTPGGHTYHARLTIAPASLQFGLLSKPDEFMAMTTIVNTKKEEFAFLVDLKSRRVEITFHCFVQDPRVNPSIEHTSQVGENARLLVYRARIPFPHLKNLVVVDEGEYKFSLLIPLQSPAILFKKGDLARSCSEGKTSWSTSDLWNRAVDIAYDTSWFKNKPVSLRGDHHFVDIGRCTTYKISFVRSDANTSVWNTMKKALEDFNVPIRDITADSLHTVPAVKPDFWQTLEPQGTNFALLAATEDVHLPFNVRYQLEVCISQGFFDVLDLSAEFLQKLSELSRTQKRRRNRAMDLLTYVAESGGPCTKEDSIMDFQLSPKRFYDPIALFTDKKAKSYYSELMGPKHCVWVRKVVITPSTIYLSTPIPEPSNRVLRQYAAHVDRFLRVQFTDELVKGRISSSPRTTQQDALFNRVHRTLHNGIEIAGRHYEFLAFGNSQFRENGAYFFSPTDDLTCDQIREWMGDVKHIKIVAKHAARLGQCFSTTKAVKNSPIGLQVITIDDIHKDGWCFTDGVGKISPTLAEFVTKPLQLMKRIQPSAFQFRHGGSKGVIVVWPDSNFNEIHLRPSQKKFEAQSEVLEIIKASGYSVATLNRQTITILSCLGVEDSVFLELQQKQMHDFSQAMVNATTAVNLLSRFVDQNGTATMMAQMIKDGFMEAKEPFFMCILQVWRAWSLRLLREKARIVVEQSAFVLGCVDETRQLRGYHKPEAGVSSNGDFPQIFLQVPRPGAPPDNPASYMVVQGLCVVGRNPSLHPGDIRVVEAVDIPALHSLRDVVVFPATGDRDIPSMCSGGDLDGDDFFVIWDRKLIPKDQNYPPMKHEPEKPVELDRDVQPSDLISFFTDYMKNDSLSTIAHAHLAQSDQLEGGPKNEVCLELARLHSDAVDYPKSGRAAHLNASLRPKSYPHFMEKPGKSYHSERILGKLYDKVAKIEFRPSYSGAFDERILRRFELPDDMLRKARIIKRQHDRAIRQIMNQREISTEFEMYTAFIMSKPRVGTEYQIQETMGPIIASHREHFRAACIKAAGSLEPSCLYPFVAATYRVTWEEYQIEARRGNGLINTIAAGQSLPFISFPWIFYHELGRIANDQQGYQLDSLPEISEGALNSDDEDEAVDEELHDPHVSVPKLVDIDEPNLGSGAICPAEDSQGTDVLEKLLSDEPSKDDPDQTLEPDEVILEEEDDTSMDKLAELVGVTF